LLGECFRDEFVFKVVLEYNTLTLERIVMNKVLVAWFICVCSMIGAKGMARYEASEK
jgi:hypothetical protein